MKKLLIIMALFYCTTASSQENNSIPLEAMIEVINNSLIEANKLIHTNEQIKGAKIEIQKAEVTLKTTYEKKAGGGFKFLFKGKKNVQKGNENVVKYTFIKWIGTYIKPMPPFLYRSWL